jgi:hypothetical protein
MSTLDDYWPVNCLGLALSFQSNNTWHTLWLVLTLQVRHQVWPRQPLYSGLCMPAVVTVASKGGALSVSKAAGAQPELRWV